MSGSGGSGDMVACRFHNDDVNDVTVSWNHAGRSGKMEVKGYLDHQKVPKGAILSVKDEYGNEYPDFTARDGAVFNIQRKRVTIRLMKNENVAHTLMIHWLQDGGLRTKPIGLAGKKYQFVVPKGAIISVGDQYGGVCPQFKADKDQQFQIRRNDDGGHEKYAYATMEDAVPATTESEDEDKANPLKQFRYIDLDAPLCSKVGMEVEPIEATNFDAGPRPKVFTYKTVDYDQALTEGEVVTYEFSMDDTTGLPFKEKVEERGALEQALEEFDKLPEDDPKKKVVDEITKALVWLPRGSSSFVWTLLYGAIMLDLSVTKQCTAFQTNQIYYQVKRAEAYRIKERKAILRLIGKKTDLEKALRSLGNPADLDKPVPVQRIKVYPAKEAEDSDNYVISTRKRFEAILSRRYSKKRKQTKRKHPQTEPTSDSLYIMPPFPSKKEKPGKSILVQSNIPKNQKKEKKKTLRFASTVSFLEFDSPTQTIQEWREAQEEGKRRLHSTRPIEEIGECNDGYALALVTWIKILQGTHPEMKDSNKLAEALKKHKWVDSYSRDVGRWAARLLRCTENALVEQELSVRMFQKLCAVGFFKREADAPSKKSKKSNKTGDKKKGKKTGVVNATKKNKNPVAATRVAANATATAPTDQKASNGKNTKKRQSSAMLQDAPANPNKTKPAPGPFVAKRSSGAMKAGPDTLANLTKPDVRPVGSSDPAKTAFANPSVTVDDFEETAQSSKGQHGPASSGEPLKPDKGEQTAAISVASREASSGQEGTKWCRLCKKDVDKNMFTDTMWAHPEGTCSPCYMDEMKNHTKERDREYLEYTWRNKTWDDKTGLHLNEEQAQRKATKIQKAWKDDTDPSSWIPKGYTGQKHTSMFAPGALLGAAAENPDSIQGLLKGRALNTFANLANTNKLLLKKKVRLLVWICDMDGKAHTDNPLVVTINPVYEYLLPWIWHLVLRSFQRDGHAKLRLDHVHFCHAYVNLQPHFDRAYPRADCADGTELGWREKWRNGKFPNVVVVHPGYFKGRGGPKVNDQIYKSDYTEDLDGVRQSHTLTAPTIPPGAMEATSNPTTSNSGAIAVAFHTPVKSQLCQPLGALSGIAAWHPNLMPFLEFAKARIIREPRNEHFLNNARRIIDNCTGLEIQKLKRKNFNPFGQCPLCQALKRRDCRCLPVLLTRKGHSLVCYQSHIIDANEKVFLELNIQNWFARFGVRLTNLNDKESVARKLDHMDFDRIELVVDKDNKVKAKMDAQHVVEHDFFGIKIITSRINGL